jgi:NADPH:quinone reductase-like Zn-dependent oxidoreductase
MVSSGFIGNEHGMGLEASGIVRQVGPRVKHLQPGATRVTAASQFCFPVASDMSLEDAATVPIGYATAIYSLLTVGQLENGQVRVLSLQFTRKMNLYSTDSPS